MRQRKDNGGVHEPPSLEQKAHTLAVVACSRDDSDACDFLAARALRAGDKTAARAHAGRACGLVFENAMPSNLEDLPRGPICIRALKLGVPIGMFYAEAKRLLLSQAGNIMRAERVRGRTRIVPDQRSKLVLFRRSIRYLRAVIHVCLSERGYVTNVRFRRSSRLWPYDRLLLEGVRRWRYTPQRKDGKPTASCTSVTFIYHQNQGRK